MSIRKLWLRFFPENIRNWKLYVITFTDGYYYVGVTSRKDPMERIREHGGRKGAKVNRGKKLKDVIELRSLGKITARQAEKEENNVMFQYRKKYGRQKVRGGHEIFKEASLIPSYVPGSLQSIIFILSCLIIGVILLVIIAQGY